VASLHALAPRFAPIVSLDGRDHGRTTPFAVEVGGQAETAARLSSAVDALIAAHLAAPERPPIAVMVTFSLDVLERVEVAAVAAALEDRGIDADRLVIRAPRYIAGMHSPALERLAAAGVTIAIASLVVAPGDESRLAGAPVDVIELPPTLVEEVDRTPGGLERLEPWLDIAHRFDWLALARNVRRPEQARALHRLGCDLAAGPLMGAPVDPAFFAAREGRSSRLAG
jgi:EAL domain-containing protein (putative c-di-GMP-specific phosphodiesterase class I)